MTESAAKPVRVLFFAAARDAAGCAELCLDASVAPPEGLSIAALAAHLSARFPALGARIRAVRFAINDEYAGDDALVRPGDEVVVIPPVAGG